jgi:hypothetical protein
MITVLETYSLSWAESTRLALLGEGIEAVVLDQHSLGAHGLGSTVRVAIVHPRDLDRASSVVANLRPLRGEPSPSWWWHKRSLVAFLAAFVAYGLALMSESDRQTRIFSAVGAMLVVTAFILIFLGLRADKQKGASTREDTSNPEGD